MTIRMKILLSFVISATIFASLIGFELYNYVEMRSEIRFLELTDTIRSKSLQLRRHEKILDVAREERCDLIVMGPSRKKGLINWLLGGNTLQKVLRFAECPVLVAGIS